MGNVMLEIGVYGLIGAVIAFVISVLVLLIAIVVHRRSIRVNLVILTMTLMVPLCLIGASGYCTLITIMISSVADPGFLLCATSAILSVLAFTTAIGGSLAGWRWAVRRE